MTFVKSPAKVLVTGANGFVAVWVVQLLVERGYSVIGTVRSESKGTYLKEKFGDNFEFAIVGGLEVGAFDEVVKSVNPDAIIHVATPVSFDTSEEPGPMIQTAIEGTLGVLQSAQRLGPNVKRVVITSSTDTLVIESKNVPSYTFTENDWNSESEQIVEREGKNTPGVHRYRASKVKAERAAWEFIDKNKDLHFDISTILPSAVFGPILQEAKDVSSLNLTTAVFRSGVINHTVFPGISNFVDVRDAALAHVLALETPEAGGERIIVSSQRYYWHDFTDALIQAGYKVKPFEPREDESVHTAALYDNSKSKRILGLEYSTPQKTAVDTYAELQKRFPESFP